MPGYKFDELLRAAAARDGAASSRSGNDEDGSSPLIAMSMLQYAQENPYIPFADDDISSKLSVAEKIRRRTILDTVECRKSAVSEKIFEELAQCFKDCDRCDYKEFSRRAGDLLSPEAAAYLSGDVFLKMVADSPSIDIESFLRYVQRDIDIATVFGDLMVHASDPHYITETELENFLFQYIPRISVLANMPEAFRPYYAFTAVRKFFFFLDERRMQKIHIPTLTESPVMEEFMFLMRLSLSESARENPKAFDQQLMNCWFSLESTMALYNGFLDLDTSQSGMLTEAEMFRFQGCGLSNTIRRDIACQFTPLAVKRVFQETAVYEPSSELDYKRYVDVILAVENRGSSASSQFFFRLLDFEHTGKLTIFGIKYFYSDVRKTLLSMGVDCPNIDNVVREMVDMMEATPLEIKDGISLQALLASGHGHIILDMLLDVNSFWRYDNRESLMNHSSSGSS